MNNNLRTNVFVLTDRLMHIGFSLEVLSGSYTMDREAVYLISKLKSDYDKFLKIEKEVLFILNIIKLSPTKLNRKKLKVLSVKMNNFLSSIEPTLSDYKPYVDEMVQGPFDTIEELTPEVNILFSSITK